MSNILKRLTISVSISIILLVSLFSPFVNTVKAQDEGKWYNQSFQEWYSKVYDTNTPATEIFGERYTAAQVQWVIYGLFAFVLNNSGGNPETTSCLMNSDIKDCVDSLKNLFSSLNSENLGLQKNQSIIGFLFEDRPLSGITYFKGVAKNLRLIPQANAQSPGFGFTALDPILPLWRATRNLAYALFVLIILILAFMIMFRVKISPQVVVTVQSALPKIAIALILVTFSYAIAGLLVDLMYLAIALIGFFLTGAVSSMGLNLPPTFYFGFLTQGPFGFGLMGIFVSYLFLFLLISTFTLLGANGLGGFLVGSVLTLGALIPIVSLFCILITIVMLIVLIVTFFRVLWMLFKAFVSILLLVLIAPFQIALGAVVPGLGFGTWLKSYLSNLAVFPVAGLLFSLSFIFLGLALSATLGNWFPSSLGEFFVDMGLAIPVVGSAIAAVQHVGWPPLLWFGVKNGIGILWLGVSAATMFIIPRASDMIQAMIEGKPFAYGTAIGEAVGPARLTAVPVGEAAYEMGKGKIFGQPVPGRVQSTAEMVSRIGEFLGVFPKHK